MAIRTLFLVNPQAGRGEIRGKMLDVIELLSAAGHTVTVHPTTGKGDILKYLPQVAGMYDMVLASGGDGTLNETVCALMSLRERPLLAYIPAGTVNDTANNLQLPRSIRKAAQIAVEGNAFPMDISSFNGNWFVYVAAFGVFTDVAYATPQQQKNLLGRLAYLLQGVRSLSEVRTYHAKVTTENESFEDDVIFGMVCSTTSVGGFSPSSKQLRSRISLNDGLSEVVLIKRPRTLLDLSNMAAALLRMDLSSRYFYFLQTDRVQIEFTEPTPWTLDGEYGGTVRAAEIINHHAALRFCVPALDGKEE